MPADSEIGVLVQLTDLDKAGLDQQDGARSLSSKNSFLGTIVIFHGSEMTRQAMVQARRLEGASRLSFAPNLLGRNFPISKLVFFRTKIEPNFS